jgi:FkbM family methyltransferase
MNSYSARATLVKLLTYYYRSGLRGSNRLTQVINKFYDLTRVNVGTGYGILNVDLTVSSGQALSYFEDSVQGEIIDRYANGVCYDIGAHLGIYSVLMARKGCTVYAFEPNKNIFKNLQQTAMRHHFIAHNLALSDFEGTADFFVPKEATMGSLVQWTDAEDIVTTHHQKYADSGRLDEIAGDVTRTSCEVRTLDSFVEENKLPLPDFIKLDVEGSEIRVFRGGRKSIEASRPTIFFEVSAGIWKKLGTSHEEGFEFFRSLDYKLFRMGEEVQTIDLEWDDILAIPSEKVGNE